MAALWASTVGFVGAVGHRHDVDVLEFRAAFAPIGVRDNVVAPHLATGVDLAPWRHPPVKERVVPSHAVAADGRLDVLQEGREPTDHSALDESERDPTELFQRHPGVPCATGPRLGLRSRPRRTHASATPAPATRAARARRRSCPGPGPTPAIGSLARWSFAARDPRPARTSTWRASAEIARHRHAAANTRNATPSRIPAAL